jgi:hypothetical protein
MSPEKPGEPAGVENFSLVHRNKKETVSKLSIPTEKQTTEERSDFCKGRRKNHYIRDQILIPRWKNNP